MKKNKSRPTIKSLVNVAMLLVVIWYAYETQKLRSLSESHLSSFEEQLNLSSQQLGISIQQMDMIDQQNKLLFSEYYQKKRPICDFSFYKNQEEDLQAQPPFNKLFVGFNNRSDLVIQNILFIHYDFVKNRFLTSEGYIGLIESNNSWLPNYTKETTYAEVKSKVMRSYQVCESCLDEYLTAKNPTSYFLSIFENDENLIYLSKAPYAESDGRYIPDISKIISYPITLGYCGNQHREAAYLNDLIN